MTNRGITMKNAITEREKDITRRILEGATHEAASIVYGISTERARQIFFKTIMQLGYEKAHVSEYRANSLEILKKLYIGGHI